MENKIFCTICTPTYNRKELLKRLYNSLCEQEDKDFEWLVIDDGSTDNTKELFDELCNEKAQINIKYMKTENGGKHRAINYALDYANGKVFAIVDSDDCLTKDAVKKIKEYFQDVATNNKNNKKFAGVVAQRCYNSKKAIGSTFKGQTIDAKSNERKKYKIDGDKFEIYYTEILKNNRFPEIENEKFMTEAILWTRIASQGYYLRWYQDKIYLCEYLEGGLTDNREKLIESSPIGYALYIKEQVKYGEISLKQKLGYYSFYYKIRKSKKNLKEISKEIDANMFLVSIAYTIRKLVEKARHLDGGK